jgi:Domain of unknown function (DUF4249)
MLWACKEPFLPPALNSPPDLLVVDGILLSGNDSSYVTISHTRSLADTQTIIPELNAEVMVADEAGPVFPLIEIGNGRYAADRLNLNVNSSFRLRINTSHGKQYESDLMPVKLTPPIDSLYWEQDSTGARILIDTQDASNKTRYYRWNYIETWKYHTDIDSYFDFVNGEIVFRPLDQHIFYCYMTRPNTNLNIATTIRLSEDIVNQHIIYSIPIGSEKLSLRYSTLVSQYAITEDAYNYWLNLKKNTEQLGTLFDAQPFTAVNGNLHNKKDTNEIVLGYMSISSLQKKRIYIDFIELFQWGYKPYYGICDTNKVLIPQAADFLGSTGYLLYTILGQSFDTLLFTEIRCGDCRVHGGTTTKPDFWQ